ncbi:MAG: hypothetical protein ACQCN6_02065 [Candidatus Bathyarchaeia archaeon]|jgi:hypothetical protein
MEHENNRFNMNRKLLAVILVAVVLIVATVLVVSFINTPSEPSEPSPLFAVTGKQQQTNATSGDYQVTSWNFTFNYNGAKTLQNVNLYLNNGDMPFKTVPSVTEGWTYQYIWTPGDIGANAMITVSWQGGTEQYEFQPQHI